MRRAALVFFSLLLSYFATWPLGRLAWADVPRLIAYQGRLAEADGSPLVGDHTVRFRIYDAETGGSILWEEEHRVTIATEDNGIFSIMLGSLTPFGTLPFNQPLWVSLEVDGEGEMAPRLRLTAVSYAINADTLDSLNGDQFLRSDVDTEAKGQLKLTRSGLGLLIQPATDPSLTTNLLEVRRAGGSAVMTLDLAGTLRMASVDFGADANDDLVASDVATLTGGSTSVADSLHTHTVNAGTQAGQLVQLDSSGALPAVSGANLTTLNASNLTSGTVPDARLPSNVSLLGQTIESVEVADGTLTTADLGTDSVGADELASAAIQPGDIEAADLPSLGRDSTSASSSLAIGTSDTTLLSVTVTKVRADSPLLIVASVSLSASSAGGSKTVAVKLDRDGSTLDGSYSATVGGGDAQALTIHAWDATTSGAHTVTLKASADKTGVTAAVRRLSVVELP